MPDLQVSTIEYAGPLVRIDRHHLPDLDSLLLELYNHPALADSTLADREDDWPTRISGGGEEGVVGFYRKNPCVCGGDHRFDLGEVGADDDGNPVGRAARGAFLGIWFA